MKSNSAIASFKWDKWINPFDSDDDDDDQNSLGDTDFADMTMIQPTLTPIDIGKWYNLWILHTGFDIEASDFNIIKDVDGVESISRLTPYRVRVAIGQCFDEDAVKIAITDALKNSKNIDK